jgi:hypothetical protein
MSTVHCLWENEWRRSTHSSRTSLYVLHSVFTRRTNGDWTVVYGSADRVTGNSPMWHCPVHNVMSSWVSGPETHYNNGSSPLVTWLSPLQVLALSKIKKSPEGTKICWHSWHPSQRDKVTDRYSRKLLWRLFPAMALSSQQSAELQKEYLEGNTSHLCIGKDILFAFTGTFLELNCHTMYYSTKDERLETITSLQEYSIMSIWWLTNITNSNSFIYGTIHNDATQLGRLAGIDVIGPLEVQVQVLKSATKWFI